MIGKGKKLFTLFGFEVRVDFSWLLLAMLVILSLSSGYFPFHYKDLSTSSYIVMGLVGALGLFVSIIIHEMCHSLVARRFGMPMHGITLFMFGGMAQMEDEARTPKAEFFMAAAGPLASFALAAVFLALFGALELAGAPRTVNGVVAYLSWINVILAIFNLLPAFPLDGGRILRSALWAWKKDLRWATRFASRLGSGFGIALIALGVLGLLGGNFVGGLWWVLIGMFLRGISRASYTQLVMKQTLEGESVRRFMKNNPVTVPPDLSVRDLVEDYIYKHHFKLFPVTEGGDLKGCVTTADIKALDRDAWMERRVGDIMKPCSKNNTIAPDADASEALQTLRKSDSQRLMVVEDGRLAGIIEMREVLKFLSLKMDLEGEEEHAGILSSQLQG